jgi:hypothetical protein
LTAHGNEDVRQTEMLTSEPLVPEHSSFKVEIGTEMLKRYKSSGTDRILAELIQAEGSTLHSELYKLINSILSKEELSQQWEKSIIVHFYKTSDKTDCSNYGGISVLQTSYKILSNILLSRLTLYIDKIIEYHQHGFQHNKSATYLTESCVHYCHSQHFQSSSCPLSLSLPLSDETALLE